MGMESYLCFHLLLVHQLDFKHDVTYKVVIDDGNIISPVDFEFIVPIMMNVCCVYEDNLISKGIFLHGVYLLFPEE